MNWGFAIEVATWAGSLAGLAIWMVLGALARQPKRPRSDEQQ